MQVPLVFCAVIVVATASAIPEKFASPVIVSPEPRVAATNLLQATFFTRQDHTRPQNRQLFLFEYHANLEFYVPGAPFYVYIKDAGEFSTRWIEEGLVVDLARETNAALFTFDQRYFGNNVVTPTASFEDMEFLTVEQTLSDIAVFINEIRNAHNGANNRIILWGSGYGGTIAAFARKRYPHLINAVWSTSGIFEVEAFTLSQLDLLNFVILFGGDEVCRSRIQYAFEVLDYLVENHYSEYIQERLNLCNPVDTNSTADIAALFESHLSAIVQYLDIHHINGINTMCDDMNFFPLDPLNSFARWKLHVFGHDINCFDHSYASSIERNSAIEFGTVGTDTGRRQWFHLQCTQLGLFSITTDLSWVPNRLSIEFHLNRCVDVLGPNYMPILLLPSVVSLRTEFGSLDQRITHIIYSNGALDPWLYNGMLFTRDQDAEVVVIEHHSKSADLTSITNADPIVLDTAKRQIRERLYEWSFA